MYRNLVVLFVLLIGPIGSVHEAAANEETATQTVQGEDKAREVVRAMSDFLAGKKKFSVQAHESIDEVDASGQKIQYANTRTMWVRRPDALRATSDGDLLQRKVWYDGKTLTIYDAVENAYMIKPVPGTIDAMIDFMAEEEGVVVPLADLAFSNFYDAVMEGVESGVYVGESRILGKACHHVAFTQEFVDWQVWIETGDRPLPKKLIITYKLLPGEPQFTAYFDKWDFSPRFGAKFFTFDAPKDAHEIPFLSEVPDKTQKHKEE